MLRVITWLWKLFVPIMWACINGHNLLYSYCSSRIILKTDFIIDKHEMANFSFVCAEYLLLEISCVSLRFHAMLVVWNLWLTLEVSVQIGILHVYLRIFPIDLGSHMMSVIWNLDLTGEIPLSEYPISFQHLPVLGQRKLTTPAFWYRCFPVQCELILGVRQSCYGGLVVK